MSARLPITTTSALTRATLPKTTFHFATVNSRIRLSLLLHPFHGICLISFRRFIFTSRRTPPSLSSVQAMESMESSYVSSPESLRNRSPPPPKSPPSDSEEKPTYLRFLVSNAAAGSVIGKGGATISEFQGESGARIQLSRNYEFFPGTSDRIIMVSGYFDDVYKAMELILGKLLKELHSEEGDEAEPRMKVKIIVPNISCGSIIGKGGAIIKSFIDKSQAGIKISPQDKNFYGLNDRLVTVMGTIEEQLHAIELILSKLIEDPHYSQNMHTPLSYAGVVLPGFHGVPYAYVLPNFAKAAINGMNYGANGVGGKFQNNKVDHTDSVTIAVPDEHIGLVVGRGGRNIMEISQVSGARIKISDRGDFMSGTNDRKVTITGSQRAIRTAESMISQKVSYATKEEQMD